VQETRTRIRLRYVPAPGFTLQVIDDVRQRLHERLGQMEIVFEEVDQVPRGAFGKFRAVVSNLAFQEQ
jgi:phenylacetate-CoA ligase